MRRRARAPRMQDKLDEKFSVTEHGSVEKESSPAPTAEAAGEKFSVPSVCVQPQTDVCARVDACAENGNADAGDSPIASVGADETARTENGDGSACGSKDGKAKRGKDGCGAVRRTSIGGQAVLEGVMMKSATTVATAVRTATGAITVESRRLKPLSEKSVFFRLPFVRGVVNLVSQLALGTGILMRSAEVYGDFTEPSAASEKTAKKLRIDPMKVVTAVSLLLGLALAIGLFVFLPNFLAGLIFEIPGAHYHPALYSLTEAAIMLAIFVAYILSITLMKDIRRVFMYHGAEHKVINCYERGLDLTVENARGCPKAHSRCGTTFMFIVIVVSIVVFALVNWMLDAVGWVTDSSVLNALIKLGVKLLFLPVVAGIAYEALKLLAKSDCLLFRVLRAPGMLLQKLTVKNPTDDMLEVSIKAFTTVMAMDADPTLPETKFVVEMPVADARAKLRAIAKSADESDIDWILVEVTGKKRGELSAVKVLTKEEYFAAKAVAEKMKEGAPLQYALGYTEFYGLRLAVSPEVLIPRPETEELAEKVIEEVRARGGGRVLDLCTGSGAVAVAVAAKTTATVTATDISPAAAETAKANALNNGVSLRALVGDMFAPVAGEEFDIVVSNPPYVTSAEMRTLDERVAKFEPRLALDGGEDGLKFYRIIAAEAARHLADGGAVFVEVGAGQAAAVAAMFDGFDTAVYRDTEGVERIVAARLSAASAKEGENR